MIKTSFHKFVCIACGDRCKLFVSVDSEGETPHPENCPFDQKPEWEEVLNDV